MPCPGPLGSCSPVRKLGVLCCVCGVLGHVASDSAVPARRVVLCLQRPGPLGSCSLVCSLGALCCVYGVLGHLAPVRPCARAVRPVAYTVFWATRLLLSGVLDRCAVLRVRCLWRLQSCSDMRTLGVLCCVCGALGHLAPVYRCARSVGCVACAPSWANWLLFTGVTARCGVLRVRCTRPLGSCSPVCSLRALSCVCGVLRPLGSCSPVCRLDVLCCVSRVLGDLAPVHRCARSVRCLVCAVSLANWLLFTGVPAGGVVLCVRCPRALGSCSPVCPLDALCCVCGDLGQLVPLHRCARSVRCAVCTVSSGSLLLFTGGHAWCVVLCGRCYGLLGSCSLVCPLGALSCVCAVLGYLAPVHQCARLVPCAVCCLCGVLGHWAPVHRCARSARRLVCGLPWATWLLFTGVYAWRVVLPVRCPGPLGSCSPVRNLGVLCFFCSVLGHLAPVHRCARSACCVACAVSWATWLLFTGVLPQCVVLRLRCPRPIGSCSPVRTLAVLCCVCGVLGHLAPVHQWSQLAGLSCVCGVPGHLAPVHRCARLVRCVACVVSWATWLLFTAVLARCVLWCVRCPGPLSFCSPVCSLGASCLVCGVLGHLAPVHGCVWSACCAAYAVSLVTWLLFTGAHALCVALCVRYPGPLGSCSPV